MKKVNNKWYDNNNNSWDCSLYTEEQAEKWSKTLVDCSYCNNCYNCYNCRNCQHCRNCRNCRNCSNCNNCNYCNSCNYCNYCRSCDNCRHCYNCNNCNNWNKTPQSIVSNYIGSRESQTTIYFSEDKIEVVCGCFKGTLEEFEAKVNNEYSEESKHGEEYRNFIKKAKVYMENKNDR